jgi:hypothetical protein
MINQLNSNQIFVFGSNLAGRHGRGAALTARVKFGAQYGVGVGPTGRCYAIPTKDARLNVLPLNVIEQYILQFVEYAKQHPELEFLLTPIGTGLAGYTMDQLASILPELPNNVILTFKLKGDE